jgi:phage terminase Nu1 subunit (DNA packaging protein)
MTEQEQVQVTQADRDAAADWLRRHSMAVGAGKSPEYEPLANVLARHRHTATADALELLKRARDREHNSYEPWNQTKLYHDLTAAIAKIEGQQP